MTAATAITPFNFNNNDVRVIVQDGNPWFVAADVCAVLGTKNHRESLRHLDDDEKGVISNDTPGGKQQVSVVNESGLYALVLRSRKPEAKKFTKWVTAEVLPSIRKTGQYARPYNPELDYDRISPAQAQDLKELVHHIAEAKVQGFGETWARLHRKFRVNSYLELPATRFAEARDYLLGKLDGHLPEPKPTAFSQAMTAARENALHYFDAVRAGQVNAPLREIPAQVLEGIVADSLMGSRFLAGFDMRTGQMQVQLVPKDASVFSFHSGDYSHAINAIPTQRLPELQDALNKRIARHLGALTA